MGATVYVSTVTYFDVIKVVDSDSWQRRSVDKNEATSSYTVCYKAILSNKTNETTFKNILEKCSTQITSNYSAVTGSGLWPVHGIIESTHSVM